MNPKALNLVLGATFLVAILAAGYGLYERGRQSERAANAEQALADSTEAYRTREKHLEGLLAADSAAEATRAALRAPVEPAVTRYVTLRDSVVITDTLLIEAADKAVTTCSLALLACESRVSSADSVIDAQQAQIRNLEAQVRTYEALSEARCDGTVPTWTLPVVGLVGAGFGAWIRGQ